MVDPAQYQQRLKDFDFDITTQRYVMRSTPGVELRSYFGSEAAKMDGYGPWGVFTRVALPLVIPGIATAMVFNVVQSINEFLLAFVLTQRKATTAPIALLNFLTPMGLDWGGISAAASMLVVPVIVLAILVRKHLIRGMSFGQLE